MFVARKGFIHKNGAALVDFIKSARNSPCAGPLVRSVGVNNGVPTTRPEPNPRSGGL